MIITSPIKRPVLTCIFLGLWLVTSNLFYYLQPLHPFKSIAHRGASYYAPENTIASFQKAVDLGFDYIELDVRLSKDEQLVVIHDEDVKRTTNGAGYIGDFTVKELKMLDAGSWFSKDFTDERIPLLEEILYIFGKKIGILIDVKSPDKQPGMIDILSNILNDHINNGLDPETVKVQSFNINELKQLKELVPDIATGLLLNKPLDLLQLASYRPYASFLSIHHQLLTKAFINKAQLLGFDIFSWTIKKQYQFPVMQRLGVHGIISDEEFRKPSYKFTSFISPVIKE
ncbi:glycerophosphodiester phosphodiesterase [Bacillus sp. JJ1474]|uniref:glycerophosphodiester phosphodiesterase n=1 Tax=Bacillus sp. JJ1474 TaxID=3122955 RepID=UPI002FFDD832